MKDQKMSTPLVLSDVRKMSPTRSDKKLTSEDAKTMQNDMEEACKNPLFLKSFALFPTEYLALPDGSVITEDKKALSVFVRWNNQICNTCRRKKDIVLLRCSCCGLVSYCSKICQRSQWPRHKEYVKHLPATPIPWRNDPHRPIFVDTSKIENPSDGFQIRVPNGKVFDAKFL